LLLVSNVPAKTEPEWLIIGANILADKLVSYDIPLEFPRWVHENAKRGTLDYVNTMFTK